MSSTMHPPITSPYIYSDIEQALIQNDFQKALDSEKKDFWINISKENWEHPNKDKWVKVKKDLKDYYIKVQDYTCPYCLQRMVVQHNGSWDAEHIIPRETHPNFSFEPLNLCVSCKDCNGEKNNKPVTSSGAKVRYPSDPDDFLIPHPHFHKYSDHIRVISIAGYYLPKTDKGRKLVEICGLLRFVYSTSNESHSPLESKQQIAKLSSELMNVSSSIEEHFILDMIAEIARNAKLAIQQANIAALKTTPITEILQED